MLVTSYEFVETSYRAVRAFPKGVKTHRNGDAETASAPPRPNAAVHSTIWEEIGMPFKRMILDECQAVNKRDGARHKAVKNIHVEARVGYSGTLAHNKWDDVDGLFDFLKGHPIHNQQMFFRLFSDPDTGGHSRQPDAKGLHLLQRFLLACTIARPSSVLKLKQCHRHRVPFLLNSAEAAAVTQLTSLYTKAFAASREKNGKRHLKYAVRALMASLHPMLRINDEVDLDYDPENPDATPDKEAVIGEAREGWLARVRARGRLIEESSRLQAFLGLYKFLMTTAAPGRKIVVFSQYLRFLDIIEEALKRQYGVECLRYDGTVLQSLRKGIESKYADPTNKKPLLITAGAGGVGLNITAASVVIQTEIWWNHNVELQAIARAHRQGQQEEVLALRLEARNGDIDLIFRNANERKTMVIGTLMGPIVRPHNQQPDIPILLHWDRLPPMDHFK